MLHTKQPDEVYMSSYDSSLEGMSGVLLVNGTFLKGTAKGTCELLPDRTVITLDEVPDCEFILRRIANSPLQRMVRKHSLNLHFALK
ncbi:unnamed protein product [Hymenolepis diminuta]|uniref:Uncharacterized protein n=1 Tax=Hymenolepis diminuta TaxID=6216 RepID=A0A564Y4I0_HYMDI|nr:unnamed protein product [Hymenolepis diminuta]